MKNDNKKVITPVFGLWQVSQLIAKIAEIEEVRNRRSDPGFKDVQRYIADTKYVLKAIEKERRILDIGAGAGVFSIALAQLGFDVTATNLVTEEAPEIHFFEKFGCAFVSTNLDEQGLPFSNEIFDAILFLHVIEHLKKPLSTLAEIRRVLKPGGTFVLMTPNGTITSIYRRASLLQGKSLQNAEHVREYTPKELLHMLSFSGFEICNIEYSNKMVSASLWDISQGIKWLLVRGYCFFCNLLPAIRYEMHLTAKAERTDVRVRGCGRHQR